MSIFKDVFKPVVRAAEVGDLTLKQINTGLYGLPLVFNTSQTVATEKSALTLSSFYNAIDILSDDIAKLPKAVYQKEGKNRNQLHDHPVNYLLAKEPHPKMIAYTFWKTIETLRLLRGNAFAEIIRNQSTGYPVHLAIRDNDEVEVFETSEKLYYKYKGRTIEQDNMLHFLGFSLDGKLGVGIITYAAAQLGVSLENQKYGETVYKNRGLTYGVIESDNEVTDPNKKLLAEGFNAKMSTQDPHKVAVLDEGMKYKRIAVTPQEAQFLETNKNGVKEVCRWLNIAPHLLKDLDSANYSNIYQQSIEHVNLSVVPRKMRHEQECDRKLFTSAEKSTTYVRFNEMILLRGDMDSKAKYYTAMVYAGINTRNEIRALEDMNPIDGLDEILQPVNMQALSIALELQKQQADGSK